MKGSVTQCRVYKRFAVQVEKKIFIPINYLVNLQSVLYIVIHLN